MNDRSQRRSRAPAIAPKVGKTPKRAAKQKKLAKPSRGLLSSFIDSIGSLIRDDSDPLSITGSLGVVGSLFASPEQQAADIAQMLRQRRQRCRNAHLLRDKTSPPTSPTLSTPPSSPERTADTGNTDEDDK